MTVRSPRESPRSSGRTAGPRTAGAAGSEDGRRIRGVWQITPGVVTDTEADELFVVLSGSATIEVEGGTAFTVGPGDMAVLRAGDRTTWTVHETLRKVYAITTPVEDS
ncbi:cupin domain-containing protein [Streptomyces zhihengii]|uniref:Cupin domain-containing protein n=1 Tax=Streptomyces zhihengii TaxID=1818004 RepID=A0ABS2UHU6_9ACTN|nr:cupin domain-containing protein [Streptomyces zhihengii]MBM9617216.1 cupin domain-containing protein [Streptomyces zhihengii]